MSNPSVLIVDYGVGNIFNVQRAFESLGATTLISHDAGEIMRAKRIVLPGVGAFQAGMAGLRGYGLVDTLQTIARQGTTPILGVCLGMQLLMDSSEENGFTHGLSLIPGQVRRFSPADEDSHQFKIPQIGWNTIELPESQPSWSGTILQSSPPGTYMYFVHSYRVIPEFNQHILAETNYGKDRFCSVIRNRLLWGCQFHPERSGQQGIALLREFLNQ